MKYIDTYLKKKKPETFMDYEPGKIPKKAVASKASAPTVGAIQESPARTYNTYTTSDRSLQNIHRNSPPQSRTSSTAPPSSQAKTVEPSARKTQQTNPYDSPVKIVGCKPCSGVDTFTDMASIPVDLLRGDYMSALFDTVGLIPLVGEVGDTAKLARIGVNSVDAVSDANRAIKAGSEIVENVNSSK